MRDPLGWLRASAESREGWSCDEEAGDLSSRRVSSASRLISAPPCDLTLDDLSLKVMD